MSPKCRLVSPERVANVLHSDARAQALWFPGCCLDLGPHARSDSISVLLHTQGRVEALWVPPRLRYEGSCEMPEPGCLGTVGGCHFLADSPIRDSQPGWDKVVAWGPPLRQSHQSFQLLVGVGGPGGAREPAEGAPVMWA
ncbi:hypothetical protein J1605_019576 [Eschrichtius robustus]|uniref:Uncharacterized protein n=1 Tax=Eschrichtius robustus TaxID=9764 RepID=A0AB34HP08_ESCRO|nr:hypothetical protein J1605_019576 [Eschrichtius robustus]